VKFSPRGVHGHDYFRKLKIAVRDTPQNKTGRERSVPLERLHSC